MQRRAGPACRHLDTHLHPLPGDTQSISMTMLARVMTSASAERGSWNVESDMGWGLFPVVYKFHIVCLFQYVICIHNVGEGKTLLVSHHLL